MTEMPAYDDLTRIRALLLGRDLRGQTPALDALDRVAAVAEMGALTMLTALPDRARNDGDPLAQRRRRRAAFIIVEAVDGVAELSPHSPTTIVEDAYELVAELIGEDLELIRAALLDARNAVAAAPAIDALDRVAAEVGHAPRHDLPG